MALDNWIFDPAGTTGFPIGVKHYRENTKESGVASFTESSGNAHRVFLVDWDQSNAFIQDVLGYSEIGGGITNVSRVLPDLHPEFPMYAMTAKRVPIDPSTVAAGISEWSRAWIDVEYRQVDYFVEADVILQTDELYRFVSRRTIPKGDYLQLQNNTFQWVSRPNPNKNLGFTPGIIIPAKTLEYVWKFVPSRTFIFGGDPNIQLRPPTEATILALIGTTNSTTFDSIYPAGTVLFTAAEATLIPPRFNNFYMWDIKYYFECKDHGAGVGGEEAGVNYLYDQVGTNAAPPNTPRWDLITTTGAVGGQRLYNSGDLNALFKIT